MTGGVVVDRDAVLEVVVAGPRKGMIIPVIAGRYARLVGVPLTQDLLVGVSSAVHELIGDGVLWWRVSAGRPGGDRYGLVQGARGGPGGGVAPAAEGGGWVRGGLW